MIRVIGFYRWQEGAHFDDAYYNGAHMHLTQQALSPHGLLRLESDRYLSNKAPLVGEIIAASNAYFATVEEAQAAMAAVGAILMADLAQYTNLRPEIRMSVVTVQPD
ncbi:MAG: EthD family reductase [Burkholderiales bacterium]|nr:EthD family reductase [Burkholderiales bacterium]